VSDEFNNDISSLEQSFLRDSFIAAARQIEGPGKRGTLNERDATKSKVHIIGDAAGQRATGLGYMKLGRVIEIPHFKLNLKTGEIAVSFDKSAIVSQESCMKQFVDSCLDTDKLKVRSMVDDRLPNDIILFGIEAGIEENYNAFFARNSVNDFALSLEKIQVIAGSLASITGEPQHRTYQPVSSQTLKFDTKYFRIYGKIAFNFLAAVKGVEFVKDSRFDPLRNWIIGNGENQFATLDNSPGLFKQLLKVKDQSIHYVVLAKVEDALIADLSFYGALKSMVILTKDFKERFKTTGLICDWRNQREYDYMAYIAKIAEQHSDEQGIEDADNITIADK
jgi:hypothetical protein